MLYEQYSRRSKPVLHRWLSQKYCPNPAILNIFRFLDIIILGMSLMSVESLTVVAKAAQSEGDTPFTIAEEHETAKLGPEHPHRLYVLDAGSPHASKIFVIDGDAANVAGMIDTGYVPNMVLPSGEDRFYVAETFWSRGARGDRVDVVTLYDKATLRPQGEVILPNGRFLANPKKPYAAITPDNRFLISFNMAPTTTVSIVDTVTMAYVGDVETPGCALIFPSAPTRFSMLCADGSLSTVTFDAGGHAQTASSDPFFDPEEDPVFEHPAFVREEALAYFVTYRGMVHPVDLSDPVPQFREPWSLLGATDYAESWRPGGWQPFAVHPPSNRLFVLMHRGEAWTHKESGTEIWIFNLADKRRIRRVPLEEPTTSIAVSRDETALLYGLTETAELNIFDARTLRLEETIDELGDWPVLIYVPGE